MNTYRWPSRTCSVIAVLIDLARLAAAHLGALRGAQRLAPGQRLARRERIDRKFRLHLLRQQFGQRAPAAGASPSGESPGSAYRCSRFSGHGLDSQTMPAASSTDGLERQHESGGRAQAGGEQAREPRALVGLRQDRPAADRHCRAARPPSCSSFGHVLVRGDEQRRRQAERGGDALAERLAPSRTSRCPAWSCRRSACRPATAARHPCARTRRAPSAAAARPDTTCPGRSAGSPPARSAAFRRLMQDLAQLRASSATAPCSSIPGHPCRRSTRTSARRPASGARRWRRDRGRPARRARRSPAIARRCRAA